MKQPLRLPLTIPLPMPIFISSADPERVVASVEPVDSGDSVDEAVNEERHLSQSKKQMLSP